MLCVAEKLCINMSSYPNIGDAVAILVRLWTCNLQVAGSIPGWAPLHSDLGQATYTCMPLSPTSIIWYWPGGEVISGWKCNGGTGRK